ncbi:Uncharacterized protein MCB1EB_1084 [Mycoavidus cysteinexigens]|uniref:Uncharacterized protein n=2 Tax=Mycoavidus cysteinexigens TaxID=1553431 RepID=A0A2Z6EVX9_9BURK|nr:Uncharacterized protein MCB1EB_1084 [Mycoavidus cysteinexigens]GLR02097.1 hypothetical protein GCM10007934_19110 [Mycoavidus cysteinexigens]
MSRSLNKALKRMFDNGKKWKKDDKDWGNEIKDFTSLQEISKENLLYVEEKTKDLTEQEQVLVDAVLGLDFHALHASPSDLGDDNTLLSRKQVKVKSKEFARNNTEQDDLDAVKTDDFVFFTLETSEQVMKPKSRFGNKTYLASIQNNQELRNGFIVLHDPAAAPSSVAHYTSAIGRRIPDMTGAEEQDQLGGTYEQLAHAILDYGDSDNKRRHEKGNEPYNCMVESRDWKSAQKYIALNLIKAIRSVTNEDDKNKLLSMTNAREVNDLISSFFGIQLLVAQKVSAPWIKGEIEQSADPQELALSEGTLSDNTEDEGEQEVK